MVLREFTIDSVRSSLMSGEWVIILKRESTEQYLPIYVGPSQANIVKRELMGIRFSESEIYERFLAGDNLAESNLESIVVEWSPNGHFDAKLLLNRRGEFVKMDCPVVGALALAFRRRARILVEENNLHEAIFDLS